MFLLGLLTGPYGAVRAWREARRLHDVPSPGGRLRRCLVFFVATMVASLVTRTITVEAFKMPSGSMAPNLQLGDHFLVNKFVYGPRLEVPFAQTALMQLPGLREPSVGDVIVFIWPKERD